MCDCIRNNFLLQENSKHVDHLSISMNFDNRDVIIDLQLNRWAFENTFRCERLKTPIPNFEIPFFGRFLLQGSHTEKLLWKVPAERTVCHKQTHSPSNYALVYWRKKTLWVENSVWCFTYLHYIGVEFITTPCYHHDSDIILSSFKNRNSQEKNLFTYEIWHVFTRTHGASSNSKWTCQFSKMCFPRKRDPEPYRGLGSRALGKLSFGTLECIMKKGFSFSKTYI